MPAVLETLCLVVGLTGREDMILCSGHYDDSRHRNENDLRDDARLVDVINAKNSALLSYASIKK